VGWQVSAYDPDLAERNRLLQQDVIALRHALEREHAEKKAMLAELNEIRYRHECAVKRLTETVREFLK
jgi:hypothetical protein